MSFETKAAKTIIICDTEPVAIQGLSALLEQSPDFRIIGKTVSLTDGAGLLQSLSPSMVVIDRAFGIHAVANWLANLRKLDQSTAAIVWGANLAECEIPVLVRSGAVGIVRKTADLDTLLSCIRTVGSGRAFIQDFFSPIRVAQPNTSRLTQRERQVLQLVEEGLGNKDIATALGIEPGTVKIHLRNIFSKTGLHRRFDLALAGMKQKAVPALTAM